MKGWKLIGRNRIMKKGKVDRKEENNEGTGS
jgi:hypothetical protein